MSHFLFKYCIVKEVKVKSYLFHLLLLVLGFKTSFPLSQQALIQCYNFLSTCTSSLCHHFSCTEIHELQLFRFFLANKLQNTCMY